MSNKFFIGSLVTVLVIVGILIGTHKSNSPQPQIVASLNSLSVSSAPWPAEEQHLGDRLKAINMALLGAEGSAQHIHVHLDILVHGQAATVPGQIGIPPTGGITPVHTHDTSGIIHIESPDAHAIYTLGQFFDIWGVKLTNMSIGGYANDTANKLIVYSDGKVVSDPINLDLTKHQEIAITYGTTMENLSIPKTYDFPSGL